MTTYQILRKAGLRRTKAREAVLNLLLEAMRPLSHQEIAIQPEVDRLDRVTLYRTLTTLQKARLAHRVQGVDGIWRFSAHGIDHAGCPGNHPHFLCLHCSKMTCLTEQALPWISVQEGAEVKGKQFVVYGLCPACASKENNTPAASRHRESRQSKRRHSASLRPGGTT